MVKNVEDILSPELLSELTTEQISALEEKFPQVIPDDEGKVLRIATDIATGTDDIETAMKNFDTAREIALQKVEMTNTKLVDKGDGLVTRMMR
ncbi:MAG: hypothetical protein WC819_04005 [Parcubacteria group bacterium]|jgi:ribosomal 50S subunit-associated protein YjgA (DUF615 family)